MRLRYTKKKGWKLYFRKGAIQLSLGRSPRKGYLAAQVSMWDDSQQAFMSIQQLKKNDQYCCAVSRDGYNGTEKDAEQIEEGYYFVNKNLIHECNNPMTCNAVKQYIKEKEDV